MKLLTRCMYALLLMAFSMTLDASVEPTISIRSQKGQSFSLHLKGMNNETYNVLLKDKNGYVLLREKVKGQEDYLKFYNLKNLPAGEYKLSIENDRENRSAKHPYPQPKSGRRSCRKKGNSKTFK